MTEKKAFGDFQTPPDLAVRVVRLVHQLYGRPDIVIEPTAGIGAFLKSAAEYWGHPTKCYGFELNPSYVQISRESLQPLGVTITQGDFFTQDWQAIVARVGKPRVLVLGNPPWVTNSEVGQLGSGNLPTKSNFQNFKGLDALTGKANFDIAEWMLIRLLESLPDDGALAMLCKTMTARKVLRHLWKTDSGRRDCRLYMIDAKAEFNVSVDACLFYVSGQSCSLRQAANYSGLSAETATNRFGYANGDLVADVESFQSQQHLDSGSRRYIWRSGIKHDAAKVMEFTRGDDRLVNGFGEIVDIESDHVFPLLKSSDLGNGRVAIRKSVLVPQHHTGDETSTLIATAPKTWKYLLRHAALLDGRKSSIYRKRPRFSVFGIGDYSFALWKIAISGLYKKPVFVNIAPTEDRPVMVDDTCYTLACRSQAEANLLHTLLSSTPAQAFFKSLMFADSKRPITAELLNRISVEALAAELGLRQELQATWDQTSEALLSC